MNLIKIDTTMSAKNQTHKPIKINEISSHSRSLRLELSQIFLRANVVLRTKITKIDLLNRLKIIIHKPYNKTYI